MAIRLIDRYPGRATAESSDYPDGAVRNKTDPTADDGTPLEQDWANDYEAFFQGILQAAGITPNGSVDTVPNSQLIEALVKVANGVTEVDVAGSSNVIISTDDSRIANIHLTGELTGDIEVQVPNTARVYGVINESTGDFDITLRTTGGSGVVVSRGPSMVRSDGDDVVRVSRSTQVLDSLDTLINSSSAAEQVYVQSRDPNWQNTPEGPQGGAHWHKTGFTNTSPSRGGAASVTTIGTGNQEGLSWDADGDEWAISYGNSPKARYQSFPVTKWSVKSGLSPAQKPGAEYDAQSNRTFFTWSGPGYDPHVAFYDHSGQYFSESIRIGPYPIQEDDDHGKPVITIGNDGSIYVFYGSHNTNQYQAKSDSPRDISSWTITEITSLPAMSYPNPCVHSSTGDIYFLFRAGSGHGSTYPSHEFGGLARTTDDGATWTDLTPVIDTTGFPGSFTDAYVIGTLEEHNDKLYMTWVVADGSSHDDVRKNVYVAYYDTADSNMYALDGTNMGTTVEFSDHASCEVRSADYTNYPHLVISNTGEIYCCWTELLSSGTQVGIFVARWNGTSWDVQDTGITCSILFNMAQLRIDNEAGIIELFAVSNDVVVPDPLVIPGADQGESLLAKGGDIVVYESDLGALNFSFKQTIARKGESACLGYRSPSVPRNSHSGLKAFYGTAALSNTEYTCPIYAATDSQRDPLRVTDMLTRLPQPRVEFYNTGAPHNVYDSNTDDGGTVPTSYREVDLSSVLPANATHAIIRIVVTVGAVTAGDEENFSVSLRRKGSDDINHVVYNASVFENDGSNSINVDSQYEAPVSFDKKLEVKLTDGIDFVPRLRLHVAGWRMW